MRIEDALTQVRVLQVQLARTEQFHCYRWATVAISGAIALTAGLMQAIWIAEPLAAPQQFLLLWISVAALNVAVIGIEMLCRWIRFHSEYARRQTLLTLGQFTPCLLVGAAVTWGIHGFCPEFAALYPCLWSAFFSLGLFASCRYLPAGAIGLAVYYLVAGLVCLRWGQGEQALRPWTMMITFGAGQFMTALVLYRQQEKADESA